MKLSPDELDPPPPERRPLSRTHVRRCCIAKLTEVIPNDGPYMMDGIIPYGKRSHMSAKVPVVREDGFFDVIVAQQRQVPKRQKRK